MIITIHFFVLLTYTLMILMVRMSKIKFELNKSVYPLVTFCEQ